MSVYPWQNTTVIGASSGPSSSACSRTPSEVVSTTSRPRSSPKGSFAAGSGRNRMRPTAYLFARAAVATPAEAAPTIAPAIPTLRRLLTAPPYRTPSYR